MDGFIDYVGQRVAALQGEALAHRPAAVRDLAELRRATPGDPRRPLPPVVWQRVLEDMPAQARGRDEQLSRWEWSAATALSLYAWHQQSQSGRMHQSGRRLGGAVRRLAQPPGSSEPAEPVVRRFNQLLTVSSAPAGAWHLRSMVTLLRGAEISVDYGRVAADLADLSVPERRPHALTRWAREFTYLPNYMNTNSKANNLSEEMEL